MEYAFLWQLAVILLSTKLLGLLTRRIALPQVVGALIAGILLGPAAFHIIPNTDFLGDVAELGVIVLMFSAGMETDLDALKRSGKSCLIIALIGVLVPLGLGFAVAELFNHDPAAVLQNVFIGVVLTATSVSITVETLREMGKLSTRSGSAILGAAIIDDVMGVILLTVAISMGGGSGSAALGPVLFKIAAFFAISVAGGMLLRKVISQWFARSHSDKQRFLIVAFSLCLLWAFIAEHFFGVADITGAYIVGVIFAGTPRIAYLKNRFDNLSSMLLSPVFFASIGLSVALPAMNGTVLAFSALLILAAVASKVVGCGIGAKLCGYTGPESLRVGVGMISRGEVALIVANKGLALGLMSHAFFGPVVLVVIFTTVLTPILLRAVYPRPERDYSDLQESPLVSAYEDAANFDLASQRLLDTHESLRRDSEPAATAQQPAANPSGAMKTPVPASHSLG